jgi:hypothetical protein
MGVAMLLWMYFMRPVLTSYLLRRGERCFCSDPIFNDTSIMWHFNLLHTALAAATEYAKKGERDIKIKFYSFNPASAAGVVCFRVTPPRAALALA